MSSFSAILNIVISLLGLALSLAVPLIILLAFRHLMAGRTNPSAALASTPASTPRRHHHWRWLGLIPLAGIALFTGLMVASIGGALYPPLTRIAAPLACDGEFSIKTSEYSYKPGQHGSTNKALCVDRTTGKPRDITTPTFLWSSLIFAGIAFVPLLLLALLLVRLGRRAFASFKSSGTGGSRPDIFRQAIENAARKNQAPSNERSVESRLRELRHLRDKDLIDADDYEARKAAILSQL